jgi:hypothetical protein
LQTLLGPRGGEVLLVMMQPGRCSFLLEQAGQEQQLRRMEPSDGSSLVGGTPDPRDQTGGAVPLQRGVHLAVSQRIQRLPCAGALRGAGDGKLRVAVRLRRRRLSGQCVCRVSALSEGVEPALVQISGLYGSHPGLSRFELGSVTAVLFGPLVLS